MKEWVERLIQKTEHAKKLILWICVILLSVLSCIGIFWKITAKQQAIARSGESFVVELNSPEETPTVWLVHVKGEVVQSGVVRLPPGSRVEDAIRSAGGATEDADLDALNLAKKIVDGEEIIVPKKGESLSIVQKDTRVNVNTANATELQTLPGVGEVTAERIITYRETYGSFTTAEDLLQVRGIGEAILQELKDKICF